MFGAVGLWCRNVDAGPHELPDATDRSSVIGGVGTSCPTCGRIDLSVADITVRCCDDTMEHSYRFRCPLCATWTVKNAGGSVLALLVRAGAKVERWRLPREVHERVDHITPISHDDVINFREALAQLPTLGR
jgi:hypothetical protein